MALGSVNVGQSQLDESSFVNRNDVGIPGGIATLDANGKLTASQRPDADYYTRSETADYVGEAILAHNSDAVAHPEIRSLIDAVDAAVRAIELRYETDVTENAFTVSFATLDDVVITGVWNAEQARIEF